mgnify:CR=1 FL=1
MEINCAVIGNTQGGLSGPAIKPIALLKCWQVHQVAKPHGIPIIVQGGICTAEDAVEFLLAGASAPLAQTRTTIGKIGRYHLAEEFCHMRYFDEMFRTNVLSHLQSVKAALPSLRSAGGSSIVLTESTSSYQPIEMASMFGASPKIIVRALSSSSPSFPWETMIPPII